MAIALTISNEQTPGQNNHLLNKWAEFMMENPFLFNQCAGVGAPMQTSQDKSGKVYLQKEREYVARHLETALTRMSGDLNYWLAPAFFSDTFPLGKGRPIQRQIFQTTYLKMISLGKRATALISAGASVTYSDPNNTGVLDTATVTIATTIANSEVKLYFRTADGAPTACDARYEIEPLIVTDNGAGTVTLTGHRSLFVSPKQWAREYIANDPNFNSPNIVDTATAAGFVTAVDIYRVFVDQTDNIELLSQDNTVLQTFTGDIVDEELGAVRMGDLCSTVCWDKQPAKVKIKYYAGSPLNNGNIDNELFEGCVAFACASMASKLQSMSYWALDLWDKYHAPMVDSMGGNLVPIATSRQAGSLYGARYGHVLASDMVLDRRIERGLKFF